MDYDDNDFHSQNPQLAGEGSTNFSPVLRPYALPKFDFDDSLQGHLRFDNLVETEVFLGIESQEDNQWIEDFSRASSGIEFSSSAAESCSISRRNNVWSEATSSESVEMLLKSVGQEEMIRGQTIIEEPDAGDKLGCSTKPMESSLKHDDGSLSRLGAVSGSSLSPVDFLESLSGLNEDSGGVLPQVEDTIQAHEGELSAYGSSSDLDPIAGGENYNLPVAQGNLLIVGDSNVEKQREVDTSIDDTFDNRTQEDSSASGMQIDHAVTSTQIIDTSVGQINIQEDVQANDISDEDAVGLSKDIGDGGEEYHVPNKEVQMNDQNLVGHAVESDAYNLGPHAVGEKHDLPQAEENLLRNSECNVVNQTEVDDSSSKSLESRTQEDSSASRMQAEYPSTSILNIDASNAILNNHEDASYENADSSGKDIGNGGEEHHVQGKEAHMNDQNMGRHSAGAYYLDSSDSDPNADGEKRDLPVEVNDVSDENADSSGKYIRSSDSDPNVDGEKRDLPVEVNDVTDENADSSVKDICSVKDIGDGGVEHHGQSKEIHTNDQNMEKHPGTACSGSVKDIGDGGEEHHGLSKEIHMNDQSKEIHMNDQSKESHPVERDAYYLDSSDMDPNVDGEKRGLLVQVNDASDNADSSGKNTTNKGEKHHLLSKQIHITDQNMVKHPFQSGAHNLDPNDLDPNTDGETSGLHVQVNDAGDENADTSSIDICDGGEEPHVMSNEVHINDQNMERHAFESGAYYLDPNADGEKSGIPVKVNDASDENVNSPGKHIADRGEEHHALIKEFHSSDQNMGRHPVESSAYNLDPNADGEISGLPMQVNGASDGNADSSGKDIGDGGDHVLSKDVHVNDQNMERLPFESGAYNLDPNADGENIGMPVQVNDASDENADNLGKDIADRGEERHSLSKEVLMNDQNVERDAVESIVYSLDPNCSDQNVDGEKGGLSVTEENLLIHGECDVANQMEVDMTSDVSLDNRAQENSSASRMQVDHLVTSAQDIGSSIMQLNNQEAVQVNDSRPSSDENEDGLLKGNGEGGGVQPVLCEVVQMNDQNEEHAVENGAYNLETIPSLASRVKSTGERPAIETRISNAEEPSSMIMKGDPASQIVEGCSEDTCASMPVQVSKCEVVTSCRDTESCDQFKQIMHEKSPIALGGENSYKGNAVEFSNTILGICASPGLKKDTLAEMSYGQGSVEKREDLLERGNEKDNVPVSNSEASLLSVKGGKPSKDQCDGSSYRQVGDISSVKVVFSSAELLTETHATKHCKGVLDPFGVRREDSNSEDLVSSSTVAKSMVYEDDVVSRQGVDGNFDRDVSVIEKENLQLPTDSSDVGCEIASSLIIHKKAESSSPGDETLNVNDKEASLKVAESILNKGDMLTQPVPPLEDSSDFGQIGQKDSEGILVPADNNCGLIPIPSSEGNASCAHDGSLSSVCMSECEDKVRVLEGGSVYADSDKPNCGSPTVISCTELCKEKENQQGVEGPLDQIAPLSNINDGSAKKVCSTSQDMKEDDALDEKSFSFEVNSLADLPGRESGKGWQPFTTIQDPKVSMIVEGSPTISGSGQIDYKLAQEVPHASPRASNGVNIVGGSRATPERKTKRGSGKAAGKESAKKGNRTKELSPMKQQLDRVEKSCVVLPSPPGTCLLVQSKEMQHFGLMERNNKKPSNAFTATSGLPDLNTSASLPAVFQQPFTDMQQVQLRAQIFVYGSLIQGATPDEACMASAFGGLDGGRNIWENAWRTSIERLHGQKFHPSTPETPLQQRSGVRASDQAGKQGTLQNKVISSPVGRASSKCTPPPVANPMIPLSSPLWSISTPSFDGMQSSGMPRGSVMEHNHAISPLHPFKITPVRNFVGHNASWSSQAPSPCSRVASPQTSASSRFSALPITETVKLTPVRESSVPLASALKLVSPSTIVHSGDPTTVFPGTASLLDVKKATSSPSSNSADPKPRKRKKVPVPENPGHISLAPQTRIEPVSLTPQPRTEPVSLTPQPRTEPVSLTPQPRTEPVSLTARTRTEPVSLTPRTRSEPVFLTPRTRVEPVSLTPWTRTEPASLLPRARTESVSTPDACNSHLFTTVTATTPSCTVSQSKSGKFCTAASSPASSTDCQKIGDVGVDQRVILSEESINNVKEAQLQAENAADLAAAAVNHCHGIWSQLDKQKISGLIPEDEAKLSYAAVAIAAAASVAKAAAAVAKVSLDAALQEQLMAEEVLASRGNENSCQSNTVPLFDGVNILGKATSASILKGEGATSCSSSVIVAAREAVRRKVEAASAASKRAENMDAIVKAAELAAEAATQAGKIVAMKDPLTLTELVKAGPEGYWKIPQVSSELALTSNNTNKGQSNLDSVEDDRHGSAQCLKGETLNEKGTQTTYGKPSTQSDLSMESMEGHTKLVDGISSSVTNREKVFRAQRGHKVSDMAKTIGVVPESEIGSKSTSITVQNEYEKAGETSKESNIKEGSLVEVFKDGDGIKAAWFSAKVLSLKNGGAYVCYPEIPSEGQVKEWVALKGEGDQAPRIRIAHPMTSIPFEGTRKRRREAVGDYTWSVGDRVDAKIRDCWWEGVITGKNDEITLTVHFPAQGETSSVKPWQLRPSLIWKDGEWIEWSGSRETKRSSHEGIDVPQEKRLKLGSPLVDPKGKDKIPEPSISEELKLTGLSSKDKIFNVGKNTRDENQPDGGGRIMRTGLQKEGSKVIFGIPKPGKKRKFMDVSKHYVAERSTKPKPPEEENDSIKVSKYLMPQGSSSRGWKNNSKVDLREKRVADSKPSRVLKSGKPQTISTSSRSLPQKQPNFTEIKDSGRHGETTSGKSNATPFRSSSSTEGAPAGPMVFTSTGLISDNPPSSSKKETMSNSKRVNKGRLAPPSGRSTRTEQEKVHNGNSVKSTPEVVEPRRSCRKIQPTSRLLEGLQSSLIISKIPAVSHDKSHKNQSRSGSSRGNNNHG